MNKKDIVFRRYAFLYNEQIPNELRELKGQMKGEKDERTKRRLQMKVTRLQQALKQETDRRVVDEVEGEWKAKEREAVSQGKNLYHLKAADKKRLVLEKKFESLKAAGQLETFMAKRRKRNAAKDHRNMPRTVQRE